MRGSLPALALLISGAAQAQSWCPPGATWTYTFSNGWTNEGYARFTYVADTVIGMDTCQLIDAFGEGWYYPSDTTFHYDLGPVVTKHSDDLVSILTTTGFDTLYWFGAAPGDHWEMTMEDGSTSFGSITITDTGSTVIQGVPLRFLVAGTDTIAERLGSYYQFMLPWVAFLIDMPGGPLRCYEDADINHHAPWWSFGCDSWLALEELPDQHVADIFPNPGADHFTINLRPGTHIIIIFDATGREVLMDRVNGPNAVVGTTLLPAGIYAVQVDGDRPIRWLKR